MRYAIVAAALLFGPAWRTHAQVSIQIGMPEVAIGVKVPVFPEMVQVPGYPVYYAPALHVNYFFYDGMYWVFEGDTWYASAWYDGPWSPVPPGAVPAFVLRVPVRFYRHPPAYFRAWRPDAPPRWDEHWGESWSRQRAGWNRWDRRSAPPPAPLPTYQKGYVGNRYPAPELQSSLQDHNYRYWPRDVAVKKAYVAHGMVGGKARGQGPKHGRESEGHGHGHGGD